ncbi:MAG: hypothetical protein ACLRVN_02750 [Butyricicoccus sp.]
MLEYMESCLASSGLSMLFAMLTNIIEEKTELSTSARARSSWFVRFQDRLRRAFGRPARCRQPQEADGGAACQSHGARRGNWVRFAEESGRNQGFSRLKLSRNYSFADKQERTAGRSKVVRSSYAETFSSINIKPRRSVLGFDEL